MKRLFDLFGSAFLLLLFTPVMVLVAICVRIFLGSPIIFRQVRPGLHGRPFTLYKFRTMRVAHSDDPQINNDEERLTGFGRWLRSVSLDELPELWNVLRGEMSLVGPRPLLTRYLPLYSPEQMRRHETPPGLTGWAQINGRNALSWDDKLALDVWYVDNRSFMLDLKIIGLTVIAVLARRGITHGESATMPEFTGAASEPLRDHGQHSTPCVDNRTRPPGRTM